MPATLRVLIADPHPVMRIGLRTLLSAEPDLTVVGEAGTAGEIQPLCLNLKPHVLLVDLSMSGVAPIQTVAALRKCCPRVRIVVYTAHDDDAFLRGVAVARVAGYVLKYETAAVVAEAIRTVGGGGSWYSRPVADRMADLRSRDDSLDALMLSQRQLEVLQYLTDGLSNKEIAARLGIREKTVEFHVTHIRGTAGSLSRVRLAVWGKTKGLAL